DAGAALRCTFAEGLAGAVGPQGLVSRTGGDEFALLVPAARPADIDRTGEQLDASLREPFLYDGRLLECSASIGASVLHEDGATRSEVMKSADIALYAAKAAGRGQLKRFRSEEFALLVPAARPADIDRTGEQLDASLREPFLYDGRLLECSASIGASVLHEDGATRSEVMKSADIALYAAKAAGRGQLKRFHPTMKVAVDRQQAMIGAARSALVHDRVVPHYQPKVRLCSAEIVGFEALLRWTDSSGVLRSPDDLSAAFEDPTLAVELSDRMFERVLDQLEAWNRV